MSTRVSVVITTYNRASVVGRAIRSALAQAGAAAHEVIVVDDGSRDGTPEVLRAFGSSIRVIRQANAGVSAARNRGVREATGDWIAFLDDDDTWEPYRLASARLAMKRYPAAIAHACDSLLVSANGATQSLLGLRGVRTDGEQPAELERPLGLVLRNCFFLQSVVLSRRHIIAVGGLRAMKFEDLDLFVRLAATPYPWTLAGRALVRVIREPGDHDTVSAGYHREPLRACLDMITIQTLALNAAEMPDEMASARNQLAIQHLLASRIYREQAKFPAWARSLITALRLSPRLRFRVRIALEFVTLGLVKRAIQRAFRSA